MGRAQVTVLGPKSALSMLTAVQLLHPRCQRPWCTDHMRVLAKPIRQKRQVELSSLGAEETQLQILKPKDIVKPAPEPRAVAPHASVFLWDLPRMRERDASG